MSFLHLIIKVFGFDPTRLAGRPTGYALAYVILMVLSVAIGIWLTLSVALPDASKIRKKCLLGVFVGMLWVTAVYHLLFIEYPGKLTVAVDTGVEEPYTVPIPLPGLRSAQFDRLSVGSPSYKNAEPWEYAAEGLKPENILATYSTIFLHWLGLLLMLTCLIAASGLSLKAVIQKIK